MVRPGGSGRREALLVPPPDHLLSALAGLQVKLLDPDPAQRLHRGQAGQPARRARVVDLPQQVVTVPAISHGQVRALGLAVRQPERIDPLPVHLLPGRVDDTGQPARRRGRQRLQRRPDRLPGQLHPVQVPAPAQDVSGIGPLPHPRPYQAQPAQPGQQRLQQRRLPPAGHQPGPEPAQHAEIEPLIVQLQAEAVLPVQPAPHRISGLPVGQVPGELQHRHHRQLRRGDPRRAPRPVHHAERLVLAPGAQLIPGPHRQRPLPERPPRHPGGTGRHLRPRMRLHRHDDPILRPGTGTREDAGRNPDYGPHHGQRPVQEPTPRAA